MLKSLLVTLSDQYITAGHTIHEGLDKSLSHGAYYTRVRKHSKGNRATKTLQAVDSKNWNALVLELGDFSQDDCVVMDMAVLVTKDPVLESTTSSVDNSLVPSSTPAKKNVFPDYVLIRFYAPVVNPVNPNAVTCTYVTTEPLKFDLTSYHSVSHIVFLHTCLTCIANCGRPLPFLSSVMKR